MAVLAGGYRVYEWYRAREWLLAGVAVAGAMLALALVLLLARKLLRRRPAPDPRLVREKVERPGHRAGLRLSVFAPEDAPREEVERKLRFLSDAYRVYDRGTGNRLVASRPREGKEAAGLTGVRPMGVLNTRELAGLWHLPQAEADVALVERTGARQVLPLPESVNGPCRIGISRRQDREVPVGLPEEVLASHALLVAKARRGKSSLLLAFARHAMRRRRALFLFDPHSDLARAALGVVPPERSGDVVYLDVANAERPFGLNLLDVALWKDRDKAVASPLKIFKQQFSGAWGTRMEDVFGHALHTLLEANEAIRRADPANGRREQYTILDVSELLSSPGFQESVLRLVRDETIVGWRRGYYANLNANQQKEFVNPVQTKVQAYARMRHARLIVGQPRSSFDPDELLRAGKVVIVDTAKGEVGEDVAALVGAALINLVAQLIAAQGAKPAGERARAMLVVDEFHTMPGADYEYVLSELPKFGANMLLATQSLGRLAALDRASGRGLVSTVFSTIDQLYAFHTSAEDARTLVPELGQVVEEADLGEMPSYHCYARLTLGGKRQPTFSVELDPPPAPNAEQFRALAASSSGFYGRSRESVENDIRSAYARKVLAGQEQQVRTHGKGGEPGQGVLKEKRRQPRDGTGRTRNVPAGQQPLQLLEDRQLNGWTVEAEQGGEDGGL